MPSEKVFTFCMLSVPTLIYNFVYSVVKWSDIHSRVKKMIRSVFEAAAKVHPEMHSPTSRAMYGVDVMLDTSFQPKLLEVCFARNFIIDGYTFEV